MRKLASLQHIKTVTKYDSTYHVTFHNVAFTALTRYVYEPGEKVVFIENDAILPLHLSTNYNISRNIQRATNQLRKKIPNDNSDISCDGTVLPQSILSNADLPIDSDVTEQLGIVKYEQEKDMNENTSNSYPSFIPKTDETRIQSMPNFLEQYQGQDRKSVV